MAVSEKPHLKSDIRTSIENWYNQSIQRIANKHWLPLISIIIPIKGRRKIMAHSILLVVEKPDVHNHNIERPWRDFVEKASDLKTNTNTDFQALAENVFLIVVDKTLDNLLDLLNLLHGHFSYKYSIFCENIEWRLAKNPI